MPRLTLCFMAAIYVNVKGMRPLGNPRSWLWVCRLVPVAFWGAWLIPALWPGLFTGGDPVTVFAPNFVHDWLVGFLAELLLMLVSVAYILLVLIILPSLIFYDEFPPVHRLLGYVLLAVVTAGLGSFLWYLLKIDPILCQMAKGGMEEPS
jgi:hypothetical protein